MKLSRREVIGALGGAAVSATAGCAGSAAPSGSTNNSTNNSSAGSRGVQSALQFPASISPDRYRDAFETVVDLVEAGADNSGQEDVTPIIEEEFDDDTLLYFPPGRYKMNSGIRRVGYENVGIIGSGAVLEHGRVDAIRGFGVQEGEFSGPAQLFKIGVPETPHTGSFLFGGFTADWRKPNTGMQILNHHTAGNSEIRNIRAVGIHSLGCQGPFRINPLEAGSSALVANIDIRHGGKTYQNTINTRSVHSGDGVEDGRSLATSGLTEHPVAKGYLRVQNMVCGGWPDNGIYCLAGPETRTEGRVDVIGCMSVNSHASNIRIGGTNSRVHGCLLVTDNTFGQERYYFEQRPIRLDTGRCSVTSTNIVQKVPTGRSISIMSDIDRALVRNVSITIRETPEIGIAISPTASNVEIDTVDFHTPGWNGTLETLFRGTPDKIRNVSIDGVDVEVGAWLAGEHGLV